MSLSDEAIYDLVAYAVSGAEHYATQPGPRDPYSVKCFDFAVRSMLDLEKGLPFNNFAGVETDDGRRIMQVIHAYRGEGYQHLCTEDRARSRRDKVAVRERIKKLFGASLQSNPDELTLDARDRVTPSGDTQCDVAELRAAGWTDTQIIRYCAPVKLHAATFADYYKAQTAFWDKVSVLVARPEPMTAASTLKTAADLVGGDRNTSHGDMTENHQNIASLWEGYLGVSIKPHDVAVMMCLLKIARTKSGRVNPDDYVDLAGYAGIAAEIKGGENNT